MNNYFSRYSFFGQQRYMIFEFPFSNWKSDHQLRSIFPRHLVAVLNYETAMTGFYIFAESEEMVRFCATKSHEIGMRNILARVVCPTNEEILTMLRLSDHDLIEGSNYYYEVFTAASGPLLNKHKPLNDPLVIQYLDDFFK